MRRWVRRFYKGFASVTCRCFLMAVTSKSYLLSPIVTLTLNRLNRWGDRSEWIWKSVILNSLMTPISFGSSVSLTSRETVRAISALDGIKLATHTPVFTSAGYYRTSGSSFLQISHKASRVFALVRPFGYGSKNFTASATPIRVLCRERLFSRRSFFSL